MNASAEVIVSSLRQPQRHAKVTNRFSFGGEEFISWRRVNDDPDFTYLMRYEQFLQEYENIPHDFQPTLIKSEVEVGSEWEGSNSYFAGFNILVVSVYEDDGIVMVVFHHKKTGIMIEKMNYFIRSFKRVYV